MLVISIRQEADRQVTACMSLTEISLLEVSMACSNDCNVGLTNGHGSWKRAMLNVRLPPSSYNTINEVTSRVYTRQLPSLVGEERQE